MGAFIFEYGIAAKWAELLRPLAVGRGSVQVASGAKMFLKPQRAYVPVGTLRRAATYPEPADSKDSDRSPMR